MQATLQNIEKVSLVIYTYACKVHTMDDMDTNHTMHIPDPTALLSLPYHEQ